MPTKISKKTQKTLDDWNSKHPIGTLVDVRKDSGEIVRGKTTSEAWLLCGSPVLNVEGIRGPYALERATPVKEDARDAG